MATPELVILRNNLNTYESSKNPRWIYFIAKQDPDGEYWGDTSRRRYAWVDGPFKRRYQAEERLRDIENTPGVAM